MSISFRALLVAHVALASAGAVACAGLLGIDDLPLAPSDAAAVASDAAIDACGQSDASYCAAFCPPADFCDDFENETPALERWNGSGGGLGGNAFRDNDANVIGIVEDESSGGHVLAASVVAPDDNASIAVVSHELRPTSGEPARGVHVRARVRVLEATFTSRDAARDDKYLYSVGFGDGQRREGVVVVLVERSKPGEFEITLQQRTLATNKTKKIELISLVSFDSAALRNNSLAFDLYLASRDVLQANGQSCPLVDPNGDPLDAAAAAALPPNDLRLVARIGPVFRCMPVYDGFATGDWLGAIQIFAGAVMGGPGTSRVQLDNISMHLLR